MTTDCCLRKGTVLNGNKYRIEKVLGQGSFGITYLASTRIMAQGVLGQMEVEVKVAIKEFFMHDFNGRRETAVTSGSEGGVFDNYRRHFIREANTLSRLEHPNIVRVLDLFEENNTAYYVMEFIEGGTLDDLISKRNRFLWGEASGFFRQISSALEFMHTNMMLHLDLKPSNIMVRRDGSAVLIDFGLAKQFDKDGNPEASTRIGYGTPGYAPLEQTAFRKGSGIPATMDIYALGATLYKMLTGRRPPVASDILNTGFQPGDFAHIADNNLVGLIKKAMAPVKSQRFQTVREFIEAASRIDGDRGEAFPATSISMFLVTDENEVIYYYRGKVYRDTCGKLLESLVSLPSVAALEASFDDIFTVSESMDYEEFVRLYGNRKEYFKIIFASFLTTNDFFRSIKLWDKSLQPMFRLHRETSYIADYYSNYSSLAHGMSDDEGKEYLHVVSYEGEETGFSASDGVIEIIGSPREKLLESPEYYIEGIRHVIQDSSMLKIELLGGFLALYLRLTSKNFGTLLLDAIPFDINFGPLWGVHIPEMIKAGTTVPTRKSCKFDFAGTDFIAIQIGDMQFRLKAENEFGYAPKEIECTVEVGTSLEDLRFIVKDIATGKELNCTFKNPGPFKLSGEAEPTVELTRPGGEGETRWNSWKEPDWT